MLRVMRKDLKKFPYRISIHQSLSEVQKISRMVMSNVLMEKIDPRSNGRPILRIWAHLTFSFGGIWKVKSMLTTFNTITIEEKH